MSNIPQQSTIHLSSCPSIMPTTSLASASSSSSTSSISSPVDPSTPSVFVPPPPSLQLFTAPPWQDSTLAKNCYSCSTPFGFLATKRHCRIGGHLCCDVCTQTRIPLPPLHTDPVAVCKKCWGRIAEAKMNGTLASSNMTSHVPNSPLASLSNESLEDNLSALALMFPEIDFELRRDILAAQQNNLARAITFLKSNGGTLSPTIATLTPSNASQHQPGVPSASSSSSSSSVSAVRSSPIPSLHLLAPDHRLTIEQKRFFYHHGFIHLTQVVPIELIQAALGEINDSLGRGINVENYHKSDNRLSYCPDIAKTAVISSLFKNSPIPKLCESLMGAGSFHQPDHGQIALTFPNGSRHGANGPQGYQAAVERWTKPELYSKNWHIDGIHKKSGGFANDEIKNFTLLVGVYLSEVRQDFAGNIAVFPGSHLELEQYFRSVDPLIRLVDDQLPQIRLNKPHQLQVRPGDVLLSHYQTAHLVTPNLSSSIRYAVYFRICHSARGWKYSDKPMKNIWIEYAGMKDIHLEAELNARKERERVESIERKREQEDMDHRAAIELQRQLNEEERRQQQQQQQQQPNQQPHIHPQPQPHQPSQLHAYPPHITPAPYATPISVPPTNFAVDYGNNPIANPFAPPYSHQPYPQHHQSIQTSYLGHPSYGHPSLQSRPQPLPPTHPQQGFAYPGSVAQPQPLLPNTLTMPNHHPSPLALAPPPGGLQLQSNPYQQPRYM